LRAGEALRDVSYHLGAEAVVAEEDVADTGYQDFGRDEPRYMRRMRM
jgi:hypothetical protein